MSTKNWDRKDLENKWGRKLPEHVAGSLPWDVLSTLASGLSEDTKLPRERLNECIRTRDVSGLFSIASDLDVTEYSSADLLLQDRLIAELFSKFDFATSPFNKREKAQLRFFQAEEACRETNFRVSRSVDLENDVNSVIHTAINIVSRALGSFNLDEMLRYCRFGPGSSLCVKGPFTTEYFKLCEKNPTTSSEAFTYAEALLAYDLKWNAYLHGIHPFDVVGQFSSSDGLGVELCLTDYNKVAFVPKNAKTERSIAIEPYFNVYFQLGVGGMIRQRLYKRCGVNLDSQERNQMLALKGSLDGKLSTIDFSMASDTISTETVRLLLPPEWFDHLDRLRSKNYMMDGSIRPYHKFSSMGNGFTFELETLIFYSIARASCEELGVDWEDVSVFGDDVILPGSACELFEKVCNYLGFTVNDEKSFTNGYFRESCGEDYLKGHRVRPVFCKELTTVQHVVSLANRLFALNRAVGFGSRVNDMLRRAVSLLHQRIPRDVYRLVVGPPSENVDGYIHTTCTARLAGSELVRWNHRLFAWEYPVIRFRAREIERRDDALALYAIWSTAVKQRSIPSKTCLIPGLAAWNRRFSGISDYIVESAPRVITGREVGKLHLGRALAWSLVDLDS